MSPKAPQVKLHIYDAADVPVSVILRRGPSRHTRMILWNRRDDSFSDGQWVRHKISYDRCDLSPDGRHFLYFMLDGKWGTETAGSYTAISRPPYFTALALYPQGDTWGGGGFFPTRDSYVIRSGGVRDIIGRADGLRRLDPDDARLEDTRASDYSTRQFGTEAGQLFELFREQDGSWRKALLRDFTNMAFERIHAPYDWRAETEETP